MSVIKAHFDGSYDPYTKTMYYAACIYENEELVARRLGTSPGGCSQEAEARAALTAICAVRELFSSGQRRDWCLVGDNLSVIDFLLYEREDNVGDTLSAVLQEARLLFDGKAIWTPRSNNHVADWTASRHDLAQNGLIVDLPVVMSSDEEQAQRRKHYNEAKRLGRYHSNPSVRQNAKAVITAYRKGWCTKEAYELLAQERYAYQMQLQNDKHQVYA